jgi:Helix-turn-helix domain
MRAAQARLVIGSRMRELRRASGVTVNHAADLSGWDKGHLSRVERGHSKPSQSLVAWYDDTFGAGGAATIDRPRGRSAARSGDHSARRPCTHSARPVGGGRRCCRRAISGRPRWLRANRLQPRRPVVTRRGIRTGRNSDGAGADLRKVLDSPERRVSCMALQMVHPTGAPGVAGRIESVSRVRVDDTAPGEPVVIEVPMVAPTIACAATAYFKITDDAGRPYFPFPQNLPLHCTVLVELSPGGTWIQAAPQSASMVHDSHHGRSIRGRLVQG